MKNEVKSLKKTQAHLGKLKNYSEKKEHSPKQKFLKQKNSFQMIKQENADLERQILDLDTKTVALFEELNLALDTYEQNKKSKIKKKTKKKSVLSNEKAFFQYILKY